MDDMDVQPRQVDAVGTHRLRDVDSKRVILIPTPSSDPNDPLNWTYSYRVFVHATICLGALMVTWLGAGPAIAIPEMTITFFGPPGRDFASKISKVAFFITTTPLTQGLGQILWMPVILKYGRRPVIIISFLLFTLTSVWCSVATSYASELAARILMGFAAGAIECAGPLMVADLFFLHERGTVMAFYTACVSGGAAVGILISGFIVDRHSWRYIFHTGTALLGGLTVLYSLTLPETCFMRQGLQTATSQESATIEQTKDSGRSPVLIEDAAVPPCAPERSYIQKLSLYNGTFTSESMLNLLIRPVVLLALPPVLWAALVEAVAIFSFVAITSNVASAFGQAYHFVSWQTGLCFVAPVIGAVLAILFGGLLSDKVADIFTVRNNGIREPEMRLPAIIFSILLAPTALVLYGVSIQNDLHWIAPTLGLGMGMFALVQSNNIAIVYTVDSFRPVAGEVLVSQFAFKSCFGFLLSFYTNPWIQKAGYAIAFGEMAAITGAVMLLAIPLYIWGKRIRQAAYRWGIMQTNDRNLDL